MEAIRDALAVLLLALVAAPAGATTRTVDLVVDENDSACIPGDCSLREALADAVDGDEIVFALPDPSPWTIRLQSGAGLGPLVVDIEVTVIGPGADELAISGDSNGDGTGDLRVLSVTATGAPAISGVAIRDGRLTSNADRDGGCVLSSGDASFVDVRFENCRAWSAPGTDATGVQGGRGGAIFATAGSGLLVEDATLLENFAGVGGGFGGASPGPGGDGGAIASLGELVVRRSTFEGNQGGQGGQGGAATGGRGGAIAVPAGVALIESSTFVANASGDGRNGAADGAGGAIWVGGGDVTLNNTTLSGNLIGATAAGGTSTGGGLQISSGTVRLRNVTVAANLSNGAGGGIARNGGTLQIANSIVGGNTSSGTASEDCTGSLSSLGFNVVRVNNGCAASLVATDQSGTAAAPLEPLLGALAVNGGPTRTHALSAGSPAIDAGDPADCLGWDPTLGVDFPFIADQCDETRPTDGDGDNSVVCDAGSFEAPTFVAPTWLLTVALGGTGSGSVSSSPGGIFCPSDCDETYIDGTDVTLTPAADTGSVFTGWSGDCTGTGACVVDMTQDRDVTATFAPAHTLTVSLAGAGSGSVSSEPAGISCPADCAEEYEEGEVVTLTALATGGSAFAGWSGDCSGTGDCQVTMSADRGVTATFVPLRTLAVSVVGSGSVTSTPPGIDCPSDCSHDFPDGEVVGLAATPDPGFEFTGLSGDCSGSGTCQVTMSQNRSVTATFQPVAVMRTLTVSVTGPGAVSSSPPGISCPGDCVQEFAEGTPVTLTATPDPGARLVAWSGDCSGSAECEVTMSIDRSVAATFDTMPFLDGFESGDTGAWSLVIP